MNGHTETAVALQLRLPAALHATLRALAQAEDRSLNNLLTHLLRQAVEAHAQRLPR